MSLPNIPGGRSTLDAADHPFLPDLHLAVPNVLIVAALVALVWWLA